MTALFTISIAVHDRADMTRRCLDSVYAHSPPGTEVIVFDNASGSETAAVLQFYSSRPGFNVLRSSKNVGFGEAHNQTLAYTGGIYFVVLNNDVVVVPGWLEAMRGLILSHPRIGIV